MVRQNYNLHYKLFSKWLKSSSSIVWRRQYTSKELREIFVREIGKEKIVAACTFSLTLNKCATEFDCKTRFEKREIKPRNFRLILYGADDNKSFLGNIKKNQRHHRPHGSIDNTKSDRNNSDRIMLERNKSLTQPLTQSQPLPQPLPQLQSQKFKSNSCKIIKMRKVVSLWLCPSSWVNVELS